MKNTFMGLCAASVIAVSSAASAADEHAHSSPNAQKAPFDAQFIDTMSQHHRDGIKMMDMALDKAESEDVKDKARMMREDQEKEIGELKSMRAEDAPEAVNMKLPGMRPMEMSKLDKLSGQKFDHAFLDMTIKHHQGGIEMARAALKSAKDANIKDKAREIIEKQSKEMAELKELHNTVKN
jgi:uncharacterized protein (DUF305 family)